jgi:hypothetical protein
MIKVKRGTTEKWTEDSGVILESGQPGYDKTKHKLKIGDGETSWSDLPYTSGLFANEIIDSESNAKTRKEADKFDITPITYGTKVPDDKTIGQIYLQEITEPEVDYVIEWGTTETGWTYQKWKSGIAKCWCNYSFKTTVQEQLELFYQSTSFGSINYPTGLFIEGKIPTETATIQSSGGQVLLANSRANTNTTSGTYTIISLAGEIGSAEYRISLQVEGFWRIINGNKD